VRRGSSDVVAGGELVGDGAGVDAHFVDELHAAGQAGVSKHLDDEVEVGQRGGVGPAGRVTQPPSERWAAAGLRYAEAVAGPALLVTTG